MARKRPALVPIQDSVVVSALGIADADSWTQWWRAFHEPSGEPAPLLRWVRLLRHRTRNKAGEAVDLLSDLRLLDIAIWMAQSQHSK